MEPSSDRFEGAAQPSARRTRGNGWPVVALRSAGLVTATAVAIVVPFLVRVLTLNALRPSAHTGTYFCHLWSRAMCRILGLDLDVEGDPPTGLFLVASNHLSYLDIWVLGSLYPSTFVAKREIRSWPLFGWIARFAGTLFVDRERAKDLVRAGQDMSRYLEAGISLTIFPEGRSTPGATILPFLPSLLEPAARAGVPCHAVTIRYETPGSDDPPAMTVCWHSNADFIEHILRLMRLPSIRATVRFADDAIRGDDRKDLARRLHAEATRHFDPVRQTPPCAP